MARDRKNSDAIVPMPGAPAQLHPVEPLQEGDDRGSTLPTNRWTGMLDRVLSVQRPAVTAHVAAIRRRHPDASPADVIRILERQYLTAVTSGGAAVGASAVIPGVGMVTSLGLSGVETVGFLEASALFAQSVTEVHGIALEDPERARTLVMAMMLGAPGTQLVKQFAAQAGGGPVRSAFWGEMVTSSLPKQLVSGIGGQIRDRFVKQFAARTGGTIVGRAIPFGIGAVVGGVGNHALGRKVVQGSRSAFGPPPAHWPFVLEPSAKRGKGSRGDELPGERPQRGLPWRRGRREDEDQQTGPHPVD